MKTVSIKETDSTMMYGQAVMVMAADSVLFMPVTPVVAVIGMPVVPNRHYGAKVVPAAMVSLPCWFISAARMVHFFKTTAGYCTTRQSTA